MKYILSILCLLSVIASCDFIAQRSLPDSREPVARVGDKFLYLEEVEPMTKGKGPVDSAEIFEAYVKQWMRNQIKLEEALKNLPEDLSYIDKRVEDYKNELYLYEYETKIVEKQLSLDISEEEANAFYLNNSSNFTLNDNVFLVKYFRVAKSLASDNLEEAKRFLASDDPGDIDLLGEFCVRQSDSYQIKEAVWFSEPMLQKLTPFTDTDFNDFIRRFNSMRGNVYVKTDDDYQYIYRIDGVALKGEVAPQPYVQKDIDKVILKKRKYRLMERLSRKMYEDALLQQKVEFFKPMKDQTL